MTKNCLFVIFATFLFCIRKGQSQIEPSLKDQAKEMRTKLSSRREVDSQGSYLELLYKIIDKIENFRCDKTTLALEASIDDLTNKMQSMEKDIDQEISKIKEDLGSNQNINVKLQRKLNEMEIAINDLKKGNYATRNIGTTYIRWGRTVCPGNGSEELYLGFAGGSYFNHQGAAASMVCLPEDPIWKKYDDTLQDGGLMYGAEYDDRYKSNREQHIIGKNHYEKEVPCVVCQVLRRSSSIMIPGRSECYPGWTKEFWGYLMSGHYGWNGATNYYCVDANQEAITGRGKNDNGYLLYFVEGRCGSLACPPYVNGRELTCVVCTK